VPPPVEKVNFPQGSKLCSVHPDVTAALQLTDRQYFAGIRNQNGFMRRIVRSHEWYVNNIWSIDPFDYDLVDKIARKNRLPANMQVPSLLSLCMRQLSPYNMAFCEYKDRVPVRAALEDLYPYKYANTVLNIQQHVDAIPPVAAPVMALMPEAMAYLYRMLGTEDQLRKHDCTLSMSNLADIYLGSSAGLHMGTDRVLEDTDFRKISLEHSGKKNRVF